MMKLNFFAGVEYKNKVFFSAFLVNGLFVMDLNTNEVKYLKMFDKEKMKERLHRRAFIYRNEAWFIPQEAEFIACVNLETLDISYYRPPYKQANFDFEKDRYFHTYFSGNVIQDRFLFLVPGDIDTVSVIDMETHKIVELYRNDDINAKQFSDVLVINDELWIFPWKGKSIIIMNIMTKEIREMKWEFEDYSYDSVVQTDREIWFAPSEAEKIAYLELDTNNICFLDLKDYKNKYSTIMKLGQDRLLMCPFDGNDFVVIDVSRKTTEYIQFEELQDIFAKEPNKMSIIDSNDKKLITTGETNYILSFEDDAKIKRIIPIGKNINEFSSYINDFMNSVDLNNVLECYGSDVEKLLGIENYLKSVLDHHRNEEEKDYNIGSNIWNIIKKN